METEFTVGEVERGPKDIMEESKPTVKGRCVSVVLTDVLVSGLDQRGE